MKEYKTTLYNVDNIFYKSVDVYRDKNEFIFIGNPKSNLNIESEIIARHNIRTGSYLEYSYLNGKTYNVIMLYCGGEEG